MSRQNIKYLEHSWKQTFIICHFLWHIQLAKYKKEFQSCVIQEQKTCGIPLKVVERKAKTNIYMLMVKAIKKI